MPSLLNPVEEMYGIGGDGDYRPSSCFAAVLVIALWEWLFSYCEKILAERFGGFGGTIQNGWIRHER